MEPHKQTEWRRLRRAAFAIFIACASAAQAEEIKRVRLAVGELAPFATNESVHGPGALVEVTQEMVRRATGNAVTAEFFPWKRAIAMVEAGPRVVVLPLTCTPERESRFRWLARLYWQNFVFVALRGRLGLSDPNLLKERHIAILRGSPHMHTLRGSGFRRVTECNSVAECMRMLKTGHADATYGGEAIHRHAAGKSDDFILGPTFREGEIWLAGSLDMSESEVQAWKAVLASLQGDGNYARILRKYDLPMLEGRK